MKRPSHLTKGSQAELSLIPIARRNRNGAIEIPAELIKESLDIYLEEFIYLRSCKITDHEVVGSFDLPFYPLTRSGLLPYLTAPLLMLVLSQLGYVFLASLASGWLSYDPFPLKTLDQFCKARDNGDILITGVSSIKFRSKVPLGAPITVYMVPHWEQHFASSMYIKSSFMVEDSAITGRFDTYIKI